MIVAEQKSLDEIRSLLRGKRKVLAVGCGTCVAVCFAGGKREVGVLASALRMAGQLDGSPVEVDELTVQRQCEAEYIEALKDKLADYDAVLSLGCGVGVQTIAEHYDGATVLPALNTKFMGGPTEQGVWLERCQGCGACLLDYTGGICPISRCPKQLQNGPCGGTDAGGRCEVDATMPCAWHLIWEKMDKLHRQDELLEVRPPKDWSTSRDGGVRRIVRDDLRKPKLESGA
ncbi:MAG: methylenetetrahydrofolate reductase C-terminal domain-containing protein [Gammaproteobacteria bacterium]|nr:methylenetetrahydrofolate reductase C-terminal domain-containing protein [Gammaproteobacteria bacterium]